MSEVGFGCGSSTFGKSIDGVFKAAVDALVRDLRASERLPGVERIWLPGEPAFGIAGLWRSWPDAALSFTMLTVNSTQHPVMERFHKPGDEKRSVVVIPPEQWDDWLACRDPEVARTFLKLFPAEAVQAEPAPRITGAPIPDAD